MVRILIVTGLVVGVLATVSQAALPPFDTTRFYSEAGFTQAIKPYNDAIAKDANDADAHYWLGVAYLHGMRLWRFGFAPYAGGYGAKAVASLERAIKLRPASLNARLALLEVYSMTGNREAYLAAFDQIVSTGRPAPLAPPK